MYFSSQGAGYGKNTYASFPVNGRIVITQGRTKKVIHIVKSDVHSETDYTNGRKTRELVYGHHHTTWKRGKATTTRYEHGTTRQVARSWYKPLRIGRKELIYPGARGLAGKREMWWTGNCLRRERFTYPNRQVAYDIRRQPKELTVLSARGKPLVVVKEYGLSSPYDYRTPRNQISGCVATELARLASGEGRGNDFKVWNTKGQLVAHGQYENGQQVGLWRTVKGEQHYLRGVPVTKTVYETPPEQLNAKDILTIPNAQLRAALLSRLGMERVVTQCDGRMIDEQPTKAMALVEIAAPIDGATRGMDTVLRILKVRCPSTSTEYYLRVPPFLKTCENARLWTLGVNVNRENGNVEQAVELVAES